MFPGSIATPILISFAVVVVRATAPVEVKVTADVTALDPSAGVFVNVTVGVLEGLLNSYDAAVN